MDIEVLVGQDLIDTWQIIGTMPMTSNIVLDSTLIRLPASDNAINIVKLALANGKKILVTKTTKNAEITVSDLVIQEQSELQCKKTLALNDINNLINQNIIQVSIIDSVDYLTCYMKLLANGIFITDQNREDKYFEIIEAAQTIDAPAPLSKNATFEEEQAYINQKAKYDTAQDNLETLEKYLNAYDKISKINSVNTLLQDTKKLVINSDTIEEIDSIIKKYKQELITNNNI